MRKVLLTGASGFIGRHCFSGLRQKGFEIHAVDLQPMAPMTEEIHWHTIDLLNSSQTNMLLERLRPTHLLHFAWFTGHGEYWHSIKNMEWIQASLELVRRFREYGGERAVLAGTCAEYDWQYGYCTEESTPLKPKTLYGICKDGLRRIVEGYSDQTGLSTAWGRIFLLFGPHESPNRLIPTVIRALLQGQLARCSHGQQIRDFLYVEDVAEAFVALLNSDITGPINIASGSPTTLKNIIFDIAEKLARPDLVQLGAIPPQPNEPRVLFADNSRLFNEVHWKPSYSLEQGLDRTIEWWQKQGNSE
jgi:nucleoside-diphosphate-sugar epimerase